MANLTKTPEPAASTVERRRDAAQLRLWRALAKASQDLIYMALQRAGGEPFAAPFEPGLPTLTMRVVRFLKQRSFFMFNSMEILQRRAQRNKFTRHGASPYRGPYTPQESRPEKNLLKPSGRKYFQKKTK
jgi:hypothetical protein